MIDFWPKSLEFVLFSLPLLSRDWSLASPEVLLKRQNMRDGVRLYLVNIQKLPILHISAENWAKKHIYVSVK